MSTRTSDGNKSARQQPSMPPRSSRQPSPQPLIPRWAWIAALALLLVAIFTAWQSQRFAGEFADLQQRIAQELQRGHSLESEQQRYQKALNIVAANGTKDIQLKPAQSNFRGNLPPVTAYWNPQVGLALSADKIPPMPSTRALQLWIVPQAGAAISAGTVRPNATGQILLVLPPMAAMSNAKFLIITDEPAEGSTAPTTRQKWSASLP